MNSVKAQEVDHDQLAKVFKALSNPNRLQLLHEIIRSGGARHKGHSCSLNAIIKRLVVGAPTISHHLKELVNAGLVTTEKDGKFVRCRVNTDAFRQLSDYFNFDSV